MKKVNFKSILTMLSVVFTLLFVGLGSASGQSTLTGATITPPQGNFVNASQAQVILGEQLSILKDQLTQMDISNPAYVGVEIKYVYYQGIDDSIKAGATVPTAIVKGLAPFMSETYDLTTSQVNLLKQDAINLLDI